MMPNGGTLSAAAGMSTGKAALTATSASSAATSDAIREV